MANKIIVGVLVVFLLVLGGLGYYSYDLHRQMDRLDEKLTALEAGQTARINTVSDQIAGLQEQTMSSLETLREQQEKTGSEIDALNQKAADAGDRIAGLEEKTDSLSANITDLAGRVENTQQDFTGSIINANDVFQKISRVTVRITDGQSVIGSGFIYDSEGHVITNYHVARELSQIYVIMDNGMVSKAGVTGFSSPSDVAVLELVNIPPIEPPVIGDSRELNVGEPVATVGSPGDSSQALGLKDTLTTGVVSQVNRYVNVDGNWVANMIQFDAAVNYGNSGGPLADSRGEIIGLITARIDPTLGDGIYYAVASNKFKRVADSIIATGAFSYPWVGVSIRNISPLEVKDKNLETIDGVFVSEVIVGSPAGAAGVLDGDIIRSIDGTPVKDTDELVSYLAEFATPGQKVSLSIVRGALKLDISVVTGVRP